LSGSKKKEAIADARSDYEKAVQRRTAEQTIYKAWKELVQEPEISLVDLLSEKTQTLCRYAPTREQVELFLSTLSPSKRTSTTTKLDDSRQSNNVKLGGHVRVILDGKQSEARDAISGLIMIIEHLAEKDSTFLERLEVTARGSSRHYIARSAIDVYPKRPDKVAYAKEINHGWFLDTNISNRTKLQIVKKAGEVAGVEVGKDIALLV